MDIQIYDTYDLREEPLFFRGIYFEDGQVKVEENNPKSQIVSIRLPGTQLERKRGENSTEVDHSGSRKFLFEKIIEFAEREYTNEDCENRTPTLKVLEDEDKLRFRIQDLCRVVLTEETQPLLCKLGLAIGFDCNFITREMLDFTITYEPIYSGAKLEIIIDGKFGSGFYDEVARGAYHDMEHEPRFKPYLEEFALDIQRSLRIYLENQ